MTLPNNRPSFQPVANPDAVVYKVEARFSILTSRLIRIEFCPTKHFEDRASQTFWYRQLPKPAFSVTETPSLLEIETEHLHLHYRPNPKGFSPNTLTVMVKTTSHVWRYGDKNYQAQNLMGTARTLDGANGHTELETGLMARAGWAVIDDSMTLVFNETGWLEPRPADNKLDLYFFGYGPDYAACLQDFAQVAGRTPLIPRWALGNWWSRYWAYTQTELTELMQEFKLHGVPVSVCIIDMDWHITHTGNTSIGWTGYTWNRELWPKPSEFLAWLHANGLKTALNLHPADGVHPHEEQYTAMATHMGVEATSLEPIPFDIANPHFAEGYFNLLHHPLETMGVDFWWIDWQQGKQSGLRGLDPLWWLNHLHFYDLGRDGQKRPFVFSRWGGLGNHRYPIGFSGDTIVSWASLEYQPYFTATAANVGYGWWSHDIGGHMGGIEDDELYVRWIQFGVFSPILRLHCSKNQYHERRPWARGPLADQLITEALRFRHALIPYLYSMAWRNYQTGLPLITPMYYSHPEAEAAYNCRTQYWFGSELLAAPYITPAHEETRLSRQVVWLPEGQWFDFFTGEHFTGGGWRTLYGELGEIPIFARSGAIVPLGPKATWGGIGNPEALDVYIFPGANNRFELYEDDGETTAYTQGQSALTEISQTWSAQTMHIRLKPVHGATELVPPTRIYRFIIRGLAQPQQIALKLNDHAQVVASEYEPATETLTLGPVRLTPHDEVHITLSNPQGTLLGERDRRIENARKCLRAFRMDSWVKAEMDAQLPNLTSGHIELRPRPEVSDAHYSVLLSVLRPN